MHLTMLAKPVADRSIYKAIKKHKFQSFVEVGLDSGKRCQNLIRVAQRFSAVGSVRYTGVDQFDARESGEPLQLIEMHRTLKAFNAKTQLVPGDIKSAVQRIANSHVRTDMIIISAGYDEASLAASWFYVPRMLHASSMVLVQENTDEPFKVLNRMDVEQLAEQSAPRRAAA